MEANKGKTTHTFCTLLFAVFMRKLFGKG